MHPIPSAIPNQMFNLQDPLMTNDDTRLRRKTVDKKTKNIKAGPNWVDLACGADHSFFVSDSKSRIFKLFLLRLVTNMFMQ